MAQGEPIKDKVLCLVRMGLAPNSLELLPVQASKKFMIEWMTDLCSTVWSLDVETRMISTWILLTPGYNTGAVEAQVLVSLEQAGTTLEIWRVACRHFLLNVLFLSLPIPGLLLVTSEVGRVYLVACSCLGAKQMVCTTEAEKPLLVLRGFFKRSPNQATTLHMVRCSTQPPVQWEKAIFSCPKEKLLLLYF